MRQAYIDKKKDEIWVKGNDGLVTQATIVKRKPIDDEVQEVIPSTEEELQTEINALQAKLAFLEANATMAKADYDTYLTM